jgi:hypothetical protein
VLGRQSPFQNDERRPGAGCPEKAEFESKKRGVADEEIG